MKGEMGRARVLFDEMRHRDAVSWNVMIKSYIENNRLDDARELFDEMPGRTSYSWNSMIMGYIKGNKLYIALKLFTVMPEKDVVSWTAIITGMCRASRVDEAWRLFKQMPEANSISWASIVSGFQQNGFPLESLHVFKEMLVAGFHPTSHSITSALAACADSATLSVSEQAYSQLYKRGFNTNTQIGNSAISMFIKSGSFENARNVFIQLDKPDTVTWNSMIMGYAQHGHGVAAMAMFHQMQKARFLPDRISFLGVLQGCSHSGLVNEGKQYFLAMQTDYGISPGPEHFAGLVDLLSRAGELEEANEVILNMPFDPTPIFWRTLLNGCRIYGNLDLGIYVADQILKVEPYNSSACLMVIDMYALAGKWKEVAEMRSKARVLFFSNEAKTLDSFFPPPTDDALFDRLMAVERNRASIVPILEQWFGEDRPIKLDNLRYIIKGLRKHRRSKHALQIFEWIDVSKRLQLSPREIAVRVDLIQKTRGLEAAEKYFYSIPIHLRADKVYAALLNCYAHRKVVEKAECVLQKLRKEFGYVHCLAFNVMLNLYSKVGKFEELHSLAQEMEEKRVIVDKFFYTIRLNAYATARDVDGMEMLLKKMEANPMNPMMVADSVVCYTIVANAYIRAGDFEKALAAVKKCEHLTRRQRTEREYECLLTLYGSMGRKGDVYRIWNEYKGVGKLRNNGYLSMISALEKLDDLDAMEKIVEEWESHKTSFDIRFPNFLVYVYCKKGNLRKAEAIIERIIESGQKASAGTWSRMACGYCENKQMDKAVQALKKTILAAHTQANLPLRLLASCLTYLESNGKFQAAEDIIKLLKKRVLVSEEFEQRLEDYIRKGKAGKLR
nr:pentatricopeptide repeat-containing protein At4g02750-like [Ipomoea batatas]